MAPAFLQASAMFSFAGKTLSSVDNVDLADQAAVDPTALNTSGTPGLSPATFRTCW